MKAHRLLLAAAIALPGLAFAQTFTFSNSTPIAVPSPPATGGIASPYPSPILVALTSCPNATISAMRARVLGFEASVPQDVDVLLSGPLGQTLVLFGDRCYTSPLPPPGIDLTFEDGAATLPVASSCSSGTYAPGQFGSVSFPLPAPQPPPPYGTTFASLGLIGGPAAAANGTWALWVVDEGSFATDPGQFARGWQIEFDITGACPPIFSYTPTPPGPVTGSHTTGLVGSTANLAIGVTVATPGFGTGAPATTTLICSPPPTPFTGFTQTPTAVGDGPVSPTSLTGTCTVAATTQTATLNCIEDRGGFEVPISFQLVCPAGIPVARPAHTLSGQALLLLALALLALGAVAYRRLS
ncbi:MAG: hypothetical protein KatS3mg125_0353 [Lysobacterales bacterium]|nr:MAG: hypothetical protein KatS3mg125_0353 [Xanthomonadales bacterium]